MGDAGNAARRDAGAREPAWGFETDPYYVHSLRMFSARPARISAPGTIR
jgi:hypothetical protein